MTTFYYLVIMTAALNGDKTWDTAKAGTIPFIKAQYSSLEDCKQGALFVYAAKREEFVADKAKGTRNVVRCMTSEELP